MKKRTIKVVILLLLVAVLLSVSSPVVHADAAQLRSTQVFMDYLDQEGVKYTYLGMDDRDEVVAVSYTLENFSSMTCKLYFRDTEEMVSLRIWDIVTATAGTNYALSVVNELNANKKFTKFVLNTSDATVQAELDMYIDAETCGRCVYDAMLTLLILVDNNEVANKLHSLE